MISLQHNLLTLWWGGTW